jgi:hypothetical protein
MKEATWKQEDVAYLKVMFRLLLGVPEEASIMEPYILF